MYSSLLVPLDGSAIAEAALPHAAQVARAFGSSVTLLEVVTSVPLAAADPMITIGAEVEVTLEAMEAEEQAAREYLARLANGPILSGLPVTTEVVRGVPAQEIIQRAQTGGVDLIVMSTHGRSGLQRMVFGSVADEVLRKAGIPILLIRPRLPHPDR